MPDDAVNAYLEASGRFPLLTADEEIELGKKIQAWLKADEDSPNYKRLKREGLKARDIFIKCNMRLVTSVARKYIKRAKSLSFEDLIHEGVIGLTRGVEKFDPVRGYKFSTYAYWWIRQSISRAVASTDRSIRLPSHIYTDLGKIKSAMDRQGVTLEELSTIVDNTPEYVKDLLQLGQNVSSLDIGVGNSESALVELVGGECNVFDDVATDHELENVRYALGMLTEKEKTTVEMYHGIDGPAFTFTDIGKKLGVSRESVRTIYSRALRRIRYCMNMTGSSVQRELTVGQ
jgi:RNA polymerase sigma factor (sigma-70 family)